MAAVAVMETKRFGQPGRPGQGRDAQVGVGDGVAAGLSPDVAAGDGASDPSWKGRPPPLALGRPGRGTRGTGRSEAGAPPTPGTHPRPLVEEAPGRLHRSKQFGVWVPSTRMGKLEYRQEGLAEMKPVIGESGGIEGVHHLRLMTLLIELVWGEKGKQRCGDGLGIYLRTVASCMKTGRLPWRVCGRRWSRGLQ